MLVCLAGYSSCSAGSSYIHQPSEASQLNAAYVISPSVMLHHCTQTWTEGNARHRIMPFVLSQIRAQKQNSAGLAWGVFGSISYCMHAFACMHTCSIFGCTFACMHMFLCVSLWEPRCKCEFLPPGLQAYQIQAEQIKARRSSCFHIREAALPCGLISFTHTVECRNTHIHTHERHKGRQHACTNKNVHNACTS